MTGNEYTTAPANSAEIAPDAEQDELLAKAERQRAASELYQAFRAVTMTPLEQLVPGYQEDDPYAYRNERRHTRGWPGVTFCVDSYPDRSYGAVTRMAMVFRESSGVVPKKQDLLVTRLAGYQEVIGYIDDYKVNPRDSSTSIVNGEYIFVRDEEGAMDVLRLPADLGSANPVEREALEYAYEILSPNESRAQRARREVPWLTPDLLKTIFGPKMPSASTRDIQAVNRKLEELITNHPAQIARLQEQLKTDDAPQRASRLGKFGRRRTEG